MVQRDRKRKFTSTKSSAEARHCTAVRNLKIENYSPETRRTEGRWRNRKQNNNRVRGGGLGGMVLGAQFTGVGRSDRELGPAICPLEAEEINIYSDHASDIGTQGKWKHYTI